MQRAVFAIGLRIRKFTAISVRNPRHQTMCMTGFPLLMKLTLAWKLTTGQSWTKKAKKVIGEIFVDALSSRNSWCELDWKIGKAFWGKGYTTEAAMTIIRYLFDEVGFHRIQAKYCVENSASERVMQKIGMSKEGILRGYFHGKDERWCDVAMYAMLSNDFVWNEDILL